MTKDRLHEIIFEADTKKGKLFDVILLIAILISVFGVILNSVESIQKDYGNLLIIIEWVFTILFTVEYILRIYSIKKPFKYIFSFMGIIDLLSIIPTYLLFLYPPIHVLVDIRAILPNCTREEIINAWNALLIGMPQENIQHQVLRHHII